MGAIAKVVCSHRIQYPAAPVGMTEVRLFPGGHSNSYIGKEFDMRYLDVFCKCGNESRFIGHNGDEIVRAIAVSGWQMTGKTRGICPVCQAKGKRK